MKKNTSELKKFLDLFDNLQKKHLYAFLYDALFLVLAGVGVFLVTKIQLQLAQKVYGANLLGQMANLQASNPEVVAQAKGTIITIMALFLLTFLFIIYSWSLTRALIWSTLLGKKVKNIFTFSIKLAAINCMWLTITVVPFYAALYKLALVYDNPLFAIASRASGYTYILFLQLIMVVVAVLYCHFTNIFYYKYLHAPKLKTIWHAVKFGVTSIPKFFKPMGIVFLFFIVLTLVGLFGKFLPEIMRSILSFGIVFFFALITRQFYINLLKHHKQ